MATAVDDVDLERDRDLVLRAQAGDDLAFASLYSRYHQRLIRFAARRVGNRADAEEIAQEAFARAYRALPAFGAERRFYSWLSVITARLCIDSLRRSWRLEIGDVTDEPVIDVAFDRIERDDDVARIVAAMDQLNPRHREVLDLREREGWSYQRIADHYDVSLGTVEALLWRARRALRREYDALGSFILGLPIIRRLATSRFGNSAHSVAAISAIGTVAALGFAGPMVSAGAAASSSPAILQVATSHGALTPAPAASSALAGGAGASTLTVRTPGGTITKSVPAPDLGPIAQVGPARLLTPEEGRQAMSQQQTVVSLGPVAVGVTPANVVPDLQQHLTTVHLPR